MRLIVKNVGWKMMYNFLGIDEKTETFYLHSIRISGRAVYSNIRAVIPNKNT